MQTVYLPTYLRRHYNKTVTSRSSSYEPQVPHYTKRLFVPVIRLFVLTLLAILHHFLFCTLST